MTAYLQMGANTENLVGETDLEEFKGIILSPVNRDPASLRQDVPTFRNKGSYDIVLDPQLYYPRSSRDNLVQQPYFPTAFDTTDHSTPEGWASVIDALAAFSEELKVDAVASPVCMPRRWSDDFYSTCVETSRLLSERLSGRINILTTCLISLSDLENETRARQIGSILTRHETDGFYVVLDSEDEPRRELADADGLATMLKLIYLLKSHAPVTVAYSSSDMILFKAAGATHCGTSKFFNLRRFTPSRFDAPPTGGGGQLAYWFEHNLLGFLREADIQRLRRTGHEDLIGGLNSRGASGQIVLDFIDANPGVAWVGKSWRQYLSWFGKTEVEADIGGVAAVNAWLKTAENNWQLLEDDNVIFDEPRNDGRWVRPWRQAVSELARGP